MSRLFFGGLPTAPDVRRIREAFASIAEGDVIKHEQLELLLSLGRAQSRYRTVTDAWRREMFASENKEIVAVPAIGFQCLAPTERVEHNVKGIFQGIRKVARRVYRTRFVPYERLDAQAQRKVDHANRIGALIVEQGADLKKSITAPPAPAQQVSQLEKR